MRLSYNILFYTLIFISLFSISFSSVEQFTVYDSKIIFNDNSTITVEKIMHLRNLHSVGIVPGEFEFELYSGNSDLEIVNFDVKNRYGDDITTRLIENDNKTALLMNLFTPILPGFEYVINISYTFEFKSSGFLFKRVEIPLKETTRIPILSGDVEIQIPQNKKFTYISENVDSVTINENILTTEITENSPETILIEYSSIPTRIGNYPGSLVFWLIVNFILILILVYQFRKEFSKFKKEGK